MIRRFTRISKSNTRYDTMNSSILLTLDETDVLEVNPIPKNNNELYLFLILIKVSIIMTVKVCQTLVNLYSYHNKKILDKHYGTSIKQLRKITLRAIDDLEAGLTTRGS